MYTFVNREHTHTRHPRTHTYLTPTGGAHTYLTPTGGAHTYPPKGVCVFLLDSVTEMYGEYEYPREGTTPRYFHGELL